MTGIEDLRVLLAHLEPSLEPEPFVFCTLPGEGYGSPAELDPIGSFVEQEGLTLILRQDEADRKNLSYSGVMRRIILKVHSSLSAVGLTAAVAGQLTRYGISANVVAAYYHDHIFVPADRAGDAIEALNLLSADATVIQS